MSGPVCPICWIVANNSLRYASQSIIMTTPPGLPRVDGQSGASTFENTAAVRQRQLADAEAGERDHGDVRQETAVRGQAQHPAVRAPLVPARHRRRAFDHAPPPPGVDRVLLERVAIVRELLDAQFGQGNDAIRTEDLELHVARIRA